MEQKKWDRSDYFRDRYAKLSVGWKVDQKDENVPWSCSRRYVIHKEIRQKRSERQRYLRNKNHYEYLERERSSRENLPEERIEQLKEYKRNWFGKQSDEKQEEIIKKRKEYHKRNHRRIYDKKKEEFLKLSPKEQRKIRDKWKEQTRKRRDRLKRKNKKRIQNEI